MIFEYALLIMIFTLAINWRGDGRNLAGLFLLISLFFDWMLTYATFIDSYVLYAAGELVLIHFMYISNGPEILVRDMIKLSILSIVVQLSGLLIWMDYYESTVYMALCQVVFILQTIRLLAHGLATRETSDTRCGSMDSLHIDNSGEKL